MNLHGLVTCGRWVLDGEAALHEAETGMMGTPMPPQRTLLAKAKAKADQQCEGPCEGTGYVPVESNDPDPKLRALWAKAEEDTPTGGMHFVMCPYCGGTGNKRPLNEKDRPAKQRQRRFKTR